MGPLAGHKTVVLGVQQNGITSCGEGGGDFSCVLRGSLRWGQGTAILVLRFVIELLVQRWQLIGVDDLEPFSWLACFTRWVVQVLIGNVRGSGLGPPARR